MYAFRTLSDNDPLLDAAPLMRALDFLRTKLEAHDTGIPLTKGRAFKRTLVAEAITTIQWPGWSEKEIYHGFLPIKVADEYHFEPLWMLHQLLLDLRFVRHYRQTLRLTKTGRTLFGTRFALFDRIAQMILFHMEPFAHVRTHGAIMGSWDIWLNVIDREARQGISGKDLTETLYGAGDDAMPFDPRTSALREGVLKPLIWLGLLEEHIGQSRKLADRVYVTTRLWGRYLALDPKPPVLRVVQ